MQQPLLRPVMPELDSIRGLAIVMVVIYHAFYWQANQPAVTLPHWERLATVATWPGRLGVNLFFVLSGFLITGILLDSRAKPDYYLRFYKRRALRILPVYLLMLVLLLAAKLIPLPFALLSLAYLSNLTPLFGVGMAFPVLWSLAVEEHFYMFWPALVRKIKMEHLLWVCCGIVLLSPVIRFMSFGYSRGFEFNEYTWNSLDGLAEGAILAISLRLWDERKTAWRILQISGIATLVLSPFAVSPRATQIGAALQIVPWQAAFLALLCASLLLGTSQYSWLVHSRILGFFGYISYGLYLIHMAVFQEYDRFGSQNLMMRFLMVSAISVLLAYLSREYFEERFLHANLGRNRQRDVRYDNL